jgi:tubulin--tyrosine ligase-like protein 12
VDLEVESTIFRLFTSKSFECSKKLLVNGHNVFMPEASENDLRLDRIHERLFKLAGCYRLASTEKLDETSVWYVNDELGSSITHSDNPQVVLVPFLYSRSCHIGEEMEAFTIMWAVKDIEEGQLIERDFLCGLPESKQRSSRLAAWYNLPR